MELDARLHLLDCNQQITIMIKSKLLLGASLLSFITLQSCFYAGHRCDTFNGVQAKKSKVRPTRSPDSKR